MVQGNGSGTNVIDFVQSCFGQQHAYRMAHHSKDESDASLAEFERLMASMGFRRSGTSSRNDSVGMSG